MGKFELASTANWVLQRGLGNFDALNEDSPSEYALVDYQDCIEDCSISRYTQTIERINDESRIEDASLLIRESGRKWGQSGRKWGQSKLKAC
jgi:hypothetical protein